MSQERKFVLPKDMLWLADQLGVDRKGLTYLSVTLDMDQPVSVTTKHKTIVNKARQEISQRYKLVLDNNALSWMIGCGPTTIRTIDESGETPT